MIDIVSLGEILIDFTRNGKNEQWIQLFVQNSDGAPRMFWQWHRNRAKKQILSCIKTAEVLKVSEEHYESINC